MDFDLPSISQSPEPEPETVKKPGRKRTKRPVKSAPDLCEVCLGKSTGYHYEVATCNGCKAFFRRIITERLKYTCKLKNKCFLMLHPGDPIPRCRACRFEKCIETGMNSLGIQSELRQELERKKQQGIPVRLEKPRSTIEGEVGELINKMLRIDAQSEKFRECAYNPQQFPSLLEGVKHEKSLLSLADEYGPMRGWPLNKAGPHYQTHKSWPSLSSLSIKRWIVYDVWTQLELAKALPFFSNISLSDRFYLFRDTLLMSTNLTKAFYSFEHKSDRLLRPDGLLYYDSPFPFHDEYRNRIRNVLGMRCLGAIFRIGLDRVEFVLLRVLVLTNPSVSGISEDAQNYLIRDRQKYTIALFRYVMAKHGAYGPARFVNILGFIDVLEHQQKDQRELGTIMSFTKPKNFTIPILDEIMKH